MLFYYFFPLSTYLIYRTFILLYLNSNCFQIAFICLQMMLCYSMMILFATAQAETSTGNCKDMLQGYLTGQLTSALGAYQVEALRREFKSFTEVIEQSMKKFKEKVIDDLERSQGNNLGLKPFNICYKLIKLKHHQIKLLFSNVTVDARNNSIIYTRWGKKTCPSSAELVHSGKINSSQWHDTVNSENRCNDVYVLIRHFTTIHLVLKSNVYVPIN